MENGKQPITPQTWTKCGEGENDYKPLKDGQKTGYEIKLTGLTKREYFAGLAIQGVIAIYEHVNFQPSLVAQKAVQIADALLKELDNNP